MILMLQPPSLKQFRSLEFRLGVLDDIDDFDFATAFALVVAPAAEDDAASPEILAGGGGGALQDAAFAFGTARKSGTTTLEALGTTLEDEDDPGGG